MPKSVKVLFCFQAALIFLRISEIVQWSVWWTLSPILFASATLVLALAGGFIVGLVDAALSTHDARNIVGPIQVTCIATESSVKTFDPWYAYVWGCNRLAPEDRGRACTNPDVWHRKLSVTDGDGHVVHPRRLYEVALRSRKSDGRCEP